MLDYASQRSYYSWCIGTQREGVGLCEVVGKEGGRSDLLSAKTIPHAFVCTGFLSPQNMVLD